MSVHVPDADTASFEELPDAGPTDLDLRGRHLLEAIAGNDPSLAADIILPREAWVAARDAQDPGGAYDVKLKASFAAQIARLSHREKGIDHAVFVSFETGPSPMRATPRRHEWKEPVWRVTRSPLTFTVDGRVRRIEVAEMVAWRGNWYVSHLREK